MRCALQLLICGLLSGCGLVAEPGLEPTPEDTPDPGPQPCAAWGQPEVRGEVDSAELDEISGLVVGRDQPDRLYVLEDSGAPAEVWALSLTGEVLDRHAIDGANNVDWEDLAIAPCGDGWCLWIADVGDNAASRASVALYRVPEPAPGASVEATAFSARYPDGAHDVEGVTWLGDELLAFTKVPGNRTAVYAWDRLTLDGDNVAEARGELDLDAGDGAVSLGVTAADATDDGQRLLLRGYFDLRWWAAGDGALDVAASVAVPFLPEGQGEAAAWDPHRRGVWTVSEAKNGRPPLHFTPCID
jgi:hypothetical protein